MQNLTKFVRYLFLGLLALLGVVTLGGCGIMEPKARTEAQEQAQDTARINSELAALLEDAAEDGTFTPEELASLIAKGQELGLSAGTLVRMLPEAFKQSYLSQWGTLLASIVAAILFGTPVSMGATNYVRDKRRMTRGEPVSTGHVEAAHPSGE